MGIGVFILELVTPIMESMAPRMPGETFPKFFTLEMFQRSLLAAVMVAIVGGFLGSFLLIRNLALIGDGLAHVSFGGVAVGIVIGAASPLWYALVFSTIASILIYELQSREILTGDASIAIFLTGMLAFGLVLLRYSGVGITVQVESYLWGSLLLTSSDDLDLIALISIASLLQITFIRSALLATTVDPLASLVQGLPVRAIGLLFSCITAAVVGSMVQVVGTLLVTALLSSVFLGLYFSAELDTGSGAMIALVAAIIFSIVALPKFFVLFNPSNLDRLSTQIPLDMPESSVIEVESEVK